MSSISIPSDEELEKRYGKYLDSSAVCAMSEWSEPNDSEAFNDKAHLKRMKKNVKAFGKLLGDNFGEKK
ncbi:hypothetical protein ACQZV8_01785 [Magnetococcales bacterium HHB-1]